MQNLSESRFISLGTFSSEPLLKTAPPTAATIGIVIPVHNRKLLLQDILRQLEEQINRDGKRLENLYIIVVDDGSTDGTSEFVRENYPQVCLVPGNGSLWWTGAIVKGMEYAIAEFEPDYFVWLNDDLSLSPHFIERLMEICNSARYEETMVGGIVTDQTYPNWVVYSGLKQGKPIRHRSEFANSPILETETISGNIVVIPRAIVQHVGLPKAEKFPHYGGDFEYVREVRNQGFKTNVSSELCANTNYQVRDLIRYMPYWMQWYLQPKLSQRWKIIKGLCDLKVNQNIWLFVNLKNQTRDRIPPWNYFFCFCAKVAKLAMLGFYPKDAIERQITQYLEDWSVPPELAARIQSQRTTPNPRSNA